MNVGEFKQLLEDRKIPDDHRLTIQYRGGLAGSTVDTRSAYLGFDWTRNQLVINPERGLCIDEWYRDLKKISGSDAAHIAGVLKAADKVVSACGDPSTVPDEIDKLRVALDRLGKFKERGF